MVANVTNTIPPHIKEPRVSETSYEYISNHFQATFLGSSTFLLLFTYFPGTSVRFDLAALSKKRQHLHL